MILPSVYIFLFVELLAVSYLDWKLKKISNIWSLINIVIFLFLVLSWPALYKIRMETFVYSLGFLVVGFGLFLMKIMGAGDSKYLFSFYLLVPSQLHEKAFFSLIYSTILCGGLLFVTNMIKNRNNILRAVRERNPDFVRGVFGKKFTYAPVILLSWIIMGWRIFA